MGNAKENSIINRYLGIDALMAMARERKNKAHKNKIQNDFRAKGGRKDTPIMENRKMSIKQ